jgi:hypothetical protein
MSVIMVGAVLVLVVMVMALAGSQLARRIFMIIAGLVGAVLLAIFFIYRQQ